MLRLEAQSPDGFLCNVFDLDSDGFVEVLREQAAMAPAKEAVRLLAGGALHRREPVSCGFQ